MQLMNKLSLCVFNYFMVFERNVNYFIHRKLLYMILYNSEYVRSLLILILLPFHHFNECPLSGTQPFAVTRSLWRVCQVCQHPLLPTGDTPCHMVKQRLRKSSRISFRPIMMMFSKIKMLHFNDTVLCGRKKFCASNFLEVLFCHPFNSSHGRRQSVTLIYGSCRFLNV